MAVDAPEEIALADPYQIAAPELLGAVGRRVDRQLYELAAEGLLVEVDAEVVYQEVELRVEY